MRLKFQETSGHLDILQVHRWENPFNVVLWLYFFHRVELWSTTWKLETRKGPETSSDARWGQLEKKTYSGNYFFWINLKSRIKHADRFPWTSFSHINPYLAAILFQLLNLDLKRKGKWKNAHVVVSRHVDVPPPHT